ncbi:GNAT family N-acetyltransferase [Paraliobacillus zengyii]|uniref:GNAT family N-acetyltransferase n=1 Tax=Paraliobacillus zengyii TaxID=2213194 RepID=UPI000DD38C6D|nr:GNAT family protein [Paraliobacillus zengyii]
MIRLEYFTEDDFEQLIEWNNGTSPAFLLQWAGPTFIFPLSKSQLSTYLEDSNQQDATKLVYKVIDVQSGRTIGHISLGNIDYRNKSARIGKVLVGDTSMRGKGTGELMIKAIVKIGFEDLHLHRLSLGVFDFNIGAINCYKKAGFLIDGLLRDYRKMNDQYWSLYEMSILETEWQRD